MQLDFGMWRVVESMNKDNAGMYEYRIVHNRRVYDRFRSYNGQRAIELCLTYAIGININIPWGSVL